MLQKTIEYVDYNGEKRKEDFYFNLNKAELIELQMSKKESMANYIEKITKTKDQPEIIKTFKEIIMKAYGEKSDDGKRFIKSEELSIGFTQTEAYNVLVSQMFEDAVFAAEFIKGMMPSEMIETEEYKEAEQEILNAIKE